MQIDFYQIFNDILNESIDVKLYIGEHEYYTENDNYSISIVYSLEKKNDFNFKDSYDFHILSLLLIDNDTSEELEVEPTEEIEKLMMEYGEIEDLSEISEDDVDDMLNNYY